MCRAAKSRQIAGLLGFDSQDQTRISTAVSEIARNAFNYARGGRVEFILEGRTRAPIVPHPDEDSGGGIADLKTILDGAYESQTGMGLGILGARRLVDQFEIESNPGRGNYGLVEEAASRRARVRAKSPTWGASRGVSRRKTAGCLSGTAASKPGTAVVRWRRFGPAPGGVEALNRELEDTNRGVVALYAELDEKADHLRRADELKTKFLSNMSHEFRSPLNSILALTGLLNDRWMAT